MGGTQHGLVDAAQIHAPLKALHDARIERFGAAQPTGLLMAIQFGGASPRITLFLAVLNQRAHNAWID